MDVKKGSRTAVMAGITPNPTQESQRRRRKYKIWTLVIPIFHYSRYRRQAKPNQPRRPLTTHTDLRQSQPWGAATGDEDDLLNVHGVFPLAMGMERKQGQLEGVQGIINVFDLK